MRRRKKPNYFLFFVLALFLLGIVAYIYARYIGTRGLIVREYTIESERVSSKLDGLRIAHFTDVHYGMTVFLPELENIVNKINSLNPDIIVFTGDLIDIDYEINEQNLNQVIDILNNLTNSAPIYAVKGNHDQGPAFRRVIAETDFTLLVNQHDLFNYNGENIVIVGLDSYTVGHQDITRAFSRVPNNDYFTITLAHEPDVIEDFSSYNIDLFLSGHSHCGQVRLPFIGSVANANGAVNFNESEYRVGETQMFISCGIGTSKLPFRSFNPPSINLYHFSADN